jgi:hypothetical protein
VLAIHELRHISKAQPIPIKNSKLKIQNSEFGDWGLGASQR